MKKQIKWQASFLLGAFIGAFIFIITYGADILDPEYDTWLLTEWYDLSQHYVGSVLYRYSGWHFPIGLADNSFYPYLASVIYTDSVPIASFILKIFSPILPETFQFFGIYGLFCYAMQGGFAKLLLRKAAGNELYANIASVFYCMITPLYHRMFYHTALGSHYLILIALVLYTYRDRIPSYKLRILAWCILGSLCITTHFTLYGMVSVMLLGYAFWEGLCREGKAARIIAFFKLLIPYLLCTIFVFYLFGGFYGSIDGSAYGLGDYSANLNSLFNPLGFSSLLKDLPHFDEQHEGQAYISLSTCFMLLVAIPGVMRERKRLWKNHKNLIIACIPVYIILWIIALSPDVTAGENLLFTIPCPDFILNAWSIFRSSGRFLWPVTYALIFISLYFSRRVLKGGFLAVLILLAMIHIYEFHGITQNLQDQYMPYKTISYTADDLDEYDFSDKSHLQFMHPYTFGEYYGDKTRAQMIGYTVYALRNHMTVSNFHFSRDDMDKLEEQIDKSMEELESGHPRNDTLYVFTYEDFYDSEITDRDYLDYIYTDEEVVVFAAE